MTRWIMLGLTILGFALAFIAKSPGLLGLGLLFGFVGLLGFVFSLAAARISANARPDVAMASVEDLAALKKPPVRAAAQPPRAQAPAGDCAGKPADRAD